MTTTHVHIRLRVLTIIRAQCVSVCVCVCVHTCVCVCITLFTAVFMRSHWHYYSYRSCWKTRRVKLRAIMKCLEAYVTFVLAETTTRNYWSTVLLENSISVQQTTVWSMVITIISLDTVLKFLMMFSDPINRIASRLWKSHIMSANNRTLLRKITDSSAYSWMAVDKHDWCYKLCWSCLLSWNATRIHYVSYNTLFFWRIYACWKSNNRNARLVVFRNFFCFGPQICNSSPKRS